jgi:hypothetical protein
MKLVLRHACCHVFNKHLTLFGGGGGVVFRYQKLVYFALVNTSILVMCLDITYLLPQ